MGINEIIILTFSIQTAPVFLPVLFVLFGLGGIFIYKANKSLITSCAAQGVTIPLLMISKICSASAWFLVISGRWHSSFLVPPQSTFVMFSEYFAVWLNWFGGSGSSVRWYRRIISPATRFVVVRIIPCCSFFNSVCVISDRPFVRFVKIITSVRIWRLRRNGFFRKNYNFYYNIRHDMTR